MQIRTTMSFWQTPSRMAKTHAQNQPNQREWLRIRAKPPNKTKAKKPQHAGRTKP